MSWVCNSPVESGDPLPPESDLPSGISSSLDALYRTHGAKLVRYAGAQAGPNDAEDTLHRSFVRLATLAPGAVANIKSPLGYLRRTLSNLLQDDRKIARRRAADRHVPLDNVEIVGPDQLAALEARDMLKRLDTAMRKLPPLTREVFLAHRIDGFSYTEIAARTGLSVRAVEYRIGEAIAFVDRHASRMR